MATGGIERPPWGNYEPVEIARLLIPIGMAVLTWLVLLLSSGALLSLQSVSITTGFVLFGLGVLFIPIYRFRPWDEDLTKRFLGFVERRRFTLTVTIGLFVLVRLPIVSELLGPVFGILLFPLRAVPQVLYGARVFYADNVGEIAGTLLFEFGRLYAEFLWLYTVAAGITWLASLGGE